MSIWEVYKRALVDARRRAPPNLWVVLAGIALGIVPIAEGVLLGRVVNALALGQGAFPIIGLWALFGLVGILAGVVVAVMADRLAHRRRLAALGQAFEHAIILPISYHAEKGSGAVVRTILAGTDALFWNWLSFLREQFVALVGILVLVPTAIYMNPTMAAILALLAVIYVLANVLVAQKTSTGQAAVEQYHNNVYGRVGDVLGNVTVVQSYARFNSEVQAMRSIMAELLTAQYPVLTWWGLLTVLTRTAATIAFVAIYAVGALLVERGQTSVGEIVTFVDLRHPDDRQARPAVGLRRAHLPVRADAAQLLRSARCHRRRAREAGRQAAGERGRQRPLRGRHLPLQEQRPGRVRRQLRGGGRQDGGAGRPHRRRQDDHPRPAPAPALARLRPHHSWTAMTSPT